MKFFHMIFFLSAILAVQACKYDMPGIMLSVNFADMGSPQSTEFAVPLFAGCDYMTLASSTQANGADVYSF
jgi:hypothetical protein